MSQKRAEVNAGSCRFVAPSRHFATAPQLGRSWSEADISSVGSQNWIYQFAPQRRFSTLRTAGLLLERSEISDGIPLGHHRGRPPLLVKLEQASMLEMTLCIALRPLPSMTARNAFTKRAD